MPVTLHQVDQAAWEADTQVRTDLARIYADAPAERLPLPADDFIREHLDGADRLFCCARFNDRLLGAVAVRRAPDAWWLSHICVRRTTRRRGVASRLLALTGEAARATGARLRIATAQLPVEEKLMLSRLGYRLTEAEAWVELDPPGGGAAP